LHGIDPDDVAPVDRSQFVADEGEHVGVGPVDGCDVAEHTSVESFQAEALDALRAESEASRHHRPPVEVMDT
jgi:hypothetical protein